MSAVRRLVMQMVNDHPEMTWRQVGVLVLCCEAPRDAPQTVRGMAAALTELSPDRPVSKPAVTRALNRLGTEELDLVRRKRDPADARSVLAVPTTAGRKFVERLLAA